MTSKERDDRNATMGLYALALVIAVVGLSYASVPLYQIFCQATGYGGTTQRATEEAFKTMKPVPGAAPIAIYFSAETTDTMPWVFKPVQRMVKVLPGETALAFYSAYNPTDKPITGVATYNVLPPKAGLYFNKIQCFCFDEQRLRPHEEIDMPVFFYVDPQILTDPAMEGLTDITLSYTFFRSGDLEVLDLEDEMRKRQGLDGKDQLQLSQTDKDKIKAWTETMSAKMGVVDKSKPAPAAPAAAAPTSADAPAASTADPA
jgi:cytochrome c oxidase assembly protein subunit 11